MAMTKAQTITSWILQLIAAAVLAIVLVGRVTRGLDYRRPALP